MIKRQTWIVSSLIVAVMVLMLISHDHLSAAADPGYKGEITDLDFWKDRDGYLYVSLKGSNIPVPSVAHQDDSRLEALIPGLRAPMSMVRLYRLDDFDSSVRSLFVRSTPDGTRLIWTWDESVEYEVMPGENSLTFRFSRNDDSSIGAVKAVRSSRGNSSVQAVDREAGDDFQFLELNTLFPGMKQEYTGELISIDLQNAEVEHVIRLITSITDYNLVLDEEVRGRISLRLMNVTWDQALDLVLIQKNLGMVHRGNIIRIATAQKLEAERDQARRAREAAAQARESMKQLEPLEHEFIQINYSTASEIMPQVRDFLSERGKVTHDARTNTLIVQDTASSLLEVRALIQNLDRPERQVYIEARIVYATEDFRRGLGIGWNFLYPEQNAFSPSGDIVGGVEYSSMNFPRMPEYTASLTGTLERVSGSLFTLDAELRLGETQNKSRTVSAPRIVTLNNVRAEIEQGLRIPIQVVDERGTRTDYEDAVLRLAVQPQITADDRLILDLELTDDSPSGDGIETRVTRTKFLVENGETIVIGGIKKTIEEEAEGRIPGLGSLPFLGWLFKNQFISDSKNELLIFIRPEIL